MQAKHVVHHDQPSLTLIKVCIEMAVRALATTTEIAEHCVVIEVQETTVALRQEKPSLVSMAAQERPHPIAPRHRCSINLYPGQDPRQPDRRSKVSL